MINGIYQLAEVQVQIVGDLPIVQSPGCCYSDDTSTEGDTIYGCSFFDVDERGGTYRTGTGPSSEEGHSYYEDCELIMGPLVEFWRFVTTPHVHTINKICIERVWGRGA